MGGSAFERRGSSYARGPAVRAADESSPRSLIDPATSPLVDAEGPRWARSDSSSPVLYLSPARRRFLAGAATRGRRPLLVTGERSALTLALGEALDSVGGAWVVASPRGFRDTRTGRRLATPEAVFEPDFDPRGADEHVRAPESVTSQVSVLASVRHRNRQKAAYGAPFALLADLLVDQAELDWGVAEPAAVAWDDERVAAFGRESLAHSPWLVVAGAGTTGRQLTGTMRLRPTKQGAEEIINLLADVGPEGSAEAGEAFAEAPEVLAELVQTGVPLMAVAFGRVGRADLHRGPVFERPAIPLALLLGAPAVSRFGVELTSLEERFDAIVVGSTRAPAVVFPLGATLSPENFSRLHEVLWALDPIALAEGVGEDFVGSLLGPRWREEAAERAATDTPGPEYAPEEARDAP